jgi:hypothetical protein
MLERKYDNFYHYVDYIFDLSVEKKMNLIIINNI